MRKTSVCILHVQAIVAMLALSQYPRVSVADVAEPCSDDRSQIRRRPGADENRPAVETPCDSTRLPVPNAENMPAPAEAASRWRTVESLGYPDNRLDPYGGNNPLKGDRPSFGRDGFLSLAATSTSLVESRRVPSGSAPAADVTQLFMNESAAFDMVLYQGDTVFKPPQYQFRFSPAVSYSRTAANGTASGQPSFSTQALFFETHLRDVSSRYDFDSVRVGIQPVTSDPRGFLLLDQPAGVRLFGTRDGNLYQYSVGWFRPLAKNAARLNDLGAQLPHEDQVVANLYRQDFLRPGVTLGLTAIHDQSDDRLRATNAGVTYFGINADGHVSRINLTGVAYSATGTYSSPDATDDLRIRAFFAATEISVDFDWVRLRVSGLFASGDGDAGDRRATGFAGLNASPVFAGADSSFFFHQRLALNGAVDLKQRDRLFTDLRSTDGSGPASFTGPGLSLAGLGADFDITPRTRISMDANRLRFAEVAALESLTGTAEISRDIGWDVSVNAFYRPFATQNVILRLSGAMLQPAAGYRALYGDGRQTSAFFNLILAY